MIHRSKSSWNTTKIHKNLRILPSIVRGQRCAMGGLLSSSRTCTFLQSRRNSFHLDRFVPFTLLFHGLLLFLCSLLHRISNSPWDSFFLLFSLGLFPNLKLTFSSEGLHPESDLILLLTLKFPEFTVPSIFFTMNSPSLLLNSCTWEARRCASPRFGRTWCLHAPRSGALGKKLVNFILSYFGWNEYLAMKLQYTLQFLLRVLNFMREWASLLSMFHQNSLSLF